MPSESNDKSSDCVESTVSDIKAFLAATKEERRRRGKYQKYSPELQEYMVSYAVKHGNKQAVRHFSEQLGTAVPESSIRNMVKLHSCISPYIRDEIGRFAANFGVESAARYFTNRLKRAVPQYVVRKFKLLYLEKFPDATKRQKDKKHKSLKKVIESNSCNKSKRYSSKTKEEIGLYACHHSSSDTAKHFSEKLEMVVKEWTVKRFHKAYLDKHQLQLKPNGDENRPAPTSKQLCTTPLVPLNVDLHRQMQTEHTSYTTPFSQQLSANHAAPHHQSSHSLYPMNQCLSENDYQSSSASVIMTQNNGTFQYQNINAIHGLQCPETSYSSHQTITSLSNEQNHNSSSYVVTPQPVTVSNDNSNNNNNNNVSTHFLVPSQSSNPEGLQQYSLADKSIQKNDNSQNNIVFFVKCENNATLIQNENMLSEQKVCKCKDIITVGDSSGVLTVPREQCPKHTVAKQDEKIVSEEDNDEDEEPLIKRIKNGEKRKKKRLRKEETGKKRGTYTMYSPELRAEIGKYAAEHTSLKASHYFSKLLGHDVPESTVRGLKEKYLRKKKHCTVTSLGYSQRGRPLRLGKYDEIVQECLKELIHSGEKVSSFLAITTAKGVLNKYAPDLLEDNGGPIKLNTTWAKSFLKRIGVRYNS